VAEVRTAGVRAVAPGEREREATLPNGKRRWRPSRLWHFPFLCQEVAMVTPLRSTHAVTAVAALALLAACAPDTATSPLATKVLTPATARANAQSAIPANLPSGEHQLGNSLIEPAWEDQSGTIIYLHTPLGGPFPTHTSSHAVAPLYLVEYPPGSNVGTMNCMGVPGNCPDHDIEVATAATQIMPSVYGNDPTLVPGHDHLVSGPSSGGDFNVAWEVVEILFTSKDVVRRLTTEEAVDDAIARGDAIEADLGFAFHCSVVGPVPYLKGVPVG
jgi:hypothetical protein